MKLIFLHPVYLWLLISIPLLIISHFLLLRYNQYRALKFANFHALKRVTGQRLITKNFTILFLRLFVLLFLILAIAQPTLYVERNIPAYDYVLAIDASASMAAQDFPPSRLEAAKTSAKSFVDKTPGSSSIAVIKFSGATFIQSSLDKNKYATKQAIDDITIMKAGGTDIPGAIITGTNILETAKEGKAVLLITDGSNTVGTFLEDSITESLTYANQRNVRVYTIGIGSETGPIGYLPEYYNISATFDPVALEKIANQTNALSFISSNNESFENAYARILENDKTGLIPYEASFGFLIIAVMLLFVEWGLINSRFRRFP
jgi:Ca-activated chloride channel homolog